MNTLQSLTRQIERLCSRTSSPSLFAHPIQRGTADLKSGEPPKSIHKAQLKPKKRRHFISSPSFFVLTVVSLTSLIGVRFYDQPKLAVGREAPETIKAPWDASIPDFKTT